MSEETYIEIKAKLDAVAIKIDCIIMATGQRDIAVSTNKQLQLIQNRIYFIPITDKVNSDECRYMKLFSDISDKIDVKYVKDGVACVIPLQHNVCIKDGDRLCVVW